MNMQQEKTNNKDLAFPIIKSPKRAIARHHQERIKAKVVRLMKDIYWRDLTETEIGKLVNTRVPCSCEGCQGHSRPRLKRGAWRHGWRNEVEYV